MHSHCLKGSLFSKTNTQTEQRSQYIHETRVKTAFLRALAYLMLSAEACAVLSRCRFRGRIRSKISTSHYGGNSTKRVLGANYHPQLYTTRCLLTIP